MNRRTLIGNTSRAAAGIVFAPVARAFGAARPIVLRRAAEGPTSLPQDFIGLGYEMSSVARIGLLSPSNAAYVNLVRQLGSSGVLRVGGIVADYTRYEPEGTPTAEPQNTVITRAALDQFAAFLRKVGWTAIWSLNFAKGSLADATAEAQAVASALGSNLNALELGNEVENYGRGSKPFRSPPYLFEQFRAEYLEWRAAILRAVPGVRFAAPDTAESVAWVEQMAQSSHDDVQLLTTHYYRNYQKQGSARQLLEPDHNLSEKLVRLRKATQSSGIPWRMCETNSFSGGGLPGVSDTLLGALWTLDFMLLLARNGCAGVNIETGVNQLGFVSSYSPIQDDGTGHNSAGASYYGMLAFSSARAKCTHSIPLETLTQLPGLTAYALGAGVQVNSVVVINRAAESVLVSLAELGMRDATVQRLSGPALDSKLGISFAGGGMTDEGLWTGKEREIAHNARVSVPAASAVVVSRRATP